MTLAERLVAIQAEHESACAEAAYLRRLAASKARISPAVGEAPGTDPAAEEIARLRERADAVSERASELKLQIAEIEKHFLDSGEAPDAGAAKQFRELQDRLALLRHRDQAMRKESDPIGAEDELKRLRAEYLGTRAEELAKTYLGLAHQLLDAATQIKALGNLALQGGNSAPLHLDPLEIPLPTRHGPGIDLQPRSLALSEQRLLETEKALKDQLASLLNC